MLQLDIPYEKLLKLEFHDFSPASNSKNNDEFLIHASLSVQPWSARPRTFKYYIAIDFTSLIVGDYLKRTKQLLEAFFIRLMKWDSVAIAGFGDKAEVILKENEALNYSKRLNAVLSSDSWNWAQEQLTDTKEIDLPYGSIRNAKMNLDAMTNLFFEDGCFLSPDFSYESSETTPYRLILVTSGAKNIINKRAKASHFSYKGLSEAVFQTLPEMPLSIFDLSGGWLFPETQPLASKGFIYPVLWPIQTIDEFDFKEGVKGLTIHRKLKLAFKATKGAEIIEVAPHEFKKGSNAVWKTEIPLVYSVSKLQFMIKIKLSNDGSKDVKIHTKFSGRTKPNEGALNYGLTNSWSKEKIREASYNKELINMAKRLRIIRFEDWQRKRISKPKFKPSRYGLRCSSKDNYVASELTAENVVKVHFVGDMDFHMEPQMRKICQEVKDFKPELVLFDLEKMTWLSSTCIGIIMVMLIFCRNSGGAFALVNVDCEIRRKLDLYALTGILISFESTKEALEAYDKYET